MKDKLLAALRLALNGDAEDVPSGWYTVRAMAEKWGMSEVNARRHVAAGIREGILERKIFRIQHSAKLYPVPHFRKLSPASKKSK